MRSTTTRCRRETDPRTALTQAAPDDARASRGVPANIPIEIVERILHKHYANWCDEPIPALGDRTPREAIATAEGRAQVRMLLRSYETNDRELAITKQRPRFSYDFLWEKLGLSREE